MSTPAPTDAPSAPKTSTAAPEAPASETASPPSSSSDRPVPPEEYNEVPQAPTRLRTWTVDEYEAMIDAGLFREDERLELIRGYLYAMSPQSDQHFDSVTLVAERLRSLITDTHHIRTQGPLTLDDDSRPEPDVMVVPGTIEEYRGGRGARPELVVEVAVTSHRFDRHTKADLYAEAGIPEYWIVDLKNRTLEVYTQPGPASYRSKTTLDPGATPPHLRPE